MKKEPSLFGEIVVFIASFLGFYKKIKIDNSEVRIPRKISEEFENMIESLAVMANMLGYHIQTEEYILYGAYFNIKHSFIINKKITHDNVRDVFVFEMKFNLYRKTLKRCYVSRVGPYPYWVSRRNKHVMNSKDIEGINRLIKML